MADPRYLATINIKRLGFAMGTSAALLYVGCVFVMLTASKDTAVAFFNSIMHGWDVEPIMRWDMPWWEALLGVAEIFILGWLIGALIAVLYNLTADRGPGGVSGLPDRTADSCCSGKSNRTTDSCCSGKSTSSACCVPMALCEVEVQRRPPGAGSNE